MAPSNLCRMFMSLCGPFQLFTGVILWIQKDTIDAMLCYFQEWVIKNYVTSNLVAVLQVCSVLGHSL